jgi:hypothetical protein
MAVLQERVRLGLALFHPLDPYVVHEPVRGRGHRVFHVRI